MDDVHHWHVDVVVSAGRRDAEEPDRVVVAAEQVVHAELPADAWSRMAEMHIDE